MPCFCSGRIGSGLSEGGLRPQNTMAAVDQSRYAHDLTQTRQNRDRLLRHPNLLHWYRQLYSHLFERVPGFSGKTVLEIGSGMSPLKLFYPHVASSDVLQLEYLDHVFDCHDIDHYTSIADRSLDILTMTNVLHHLRNPVNFLERAVVKLKPGGEIVMVEPYFSCVSSPLYRIVHPERTDFSVAQPDLSEVSGPLTSSNQAVPYMLFFTRHDWLSPLSDYYDTRHVRIEFFSSLSYMMTGGVSRIIPLPASWYRALFPLDRFLAQLAPKVFAAFFIARMSVKG